MNDTNRLIDLLCINTIRTLSMDGVQKANSGHPGAPMGMAPACYVLWDRFLRHNPADPSFANRDRFVLSMGHASMLLYSTLHLAGYELTLDDIKSFRQLHSKCAGHPESTLIPGVEMTTGPLGQGASTSVGMAIAERWLASYFNRPGHEIVDYSVFAQCSDGDFMEGVSSEAASLAGHLGLGNLTWIYDNNSISIDGSTEIAYTEDVAGRFKAYGWHVQRVHDANNVDALHAAYEAAIGEKKRPSLVMVDSQIGFGSPNRAGTPKAHGEPLGADEIRLAKQAYGWDPDKQFYVPEEVTAHMTQGAKRRGGTLQADWDKRFNAYTEAHPDLAAQWRTMQRGELPKGWDEGWPVFDAGAKGVATRVSGGQVLEAIAQRVPWVMGGSADLVASTRTKVPDSEYFSKENHDGRNIAFGVREHGMAAIMNGLALSKIRPFGSSFMTFTDYCRPSIRIAALSNLPSTFIFTHDSICLGEDGPTHQPIEHLASLRAMPNLDVIRPGDANEVVYAWRHIMGTMDRPALMALTRQNVPTFDRKKFKSAEGVLRGAYVLADCTGVPEIILIGTGSELSLCVEAGAKLAAEGAKVRVVSMPCWELFERQEAAYRDSVLPPEVTARVSVEAGSTMGWSRWVGSEGVSIGIDRFGESAPLKDLLDEFGFTSENVTRVAQSLLKKTGGERGNGKSAKSRGTGIECATL